MITVEKAKKLRAIIERAVAALELDNEAALECVELFPAWENGNIIAEASCDSLQRLVLCYEEELTRIRNETHEDSFTVETEFERRRMPPL